MKKYSGMELIRELSLAFGPSGCEDAVRDLITEQILGACDAYTVDKAGNLIARIRGRGLDYNPDSPRRLMLAAHMDEVGFMITDITEEGYLRFGTVGGIDSRVLPGRHVVVGEKARVAGVIASKAIHLQTADERKKLVPLSQMYIDIGATDRADAEKLVSIGDYATFESDFVTFGKDGNRMKGKALDDRAGCAALIEIMRDLRKNPCDMPFDVYFAFTRCEEVGISGASVAAFAIEPDLAMILESTAIHDLPDVAANARVGRLGAGGALSLADRATIYDQNFIAYARRTAEQAEIACQVKESVSGGNDAAHIQRSLDGVRVLALSLPTRYIHSASCVADYRDYESMLALTKAMVRDWKLD